MSHFERTTWKSGRMLKCIFAAKDSNYEFGKEYFIMDGWNEDYHEWWVAVSEDDHRAIHEVWKAPSGLCYVLKRHCQPWDGVWAIFEKVES